MEAPPRSPSPIAELLASPRPAAIWLRRLLLAAALVAGLSASATVIRYLAAPWRYEKDFLQEYLFARAVLGQTAPYQPLDALAARFLPRLAIPMFPHPTPHPPPVIFVALPFGLLPYEQAQAAWLVLEVICFAVALRLLTQPLFPGLGLGRFVILTLLTVPLLHFWEEFGLGQLMMLQLLLLVGVWRAWRGGRATLAALLLGLALALKLIAWPLILLLLIRRERRAALIAAATFVCANLAAAAIVGISEVVYYYTAVGRWVWGIYRADWGNFALASIPWRLFDGTGSGLFGGSQTPPLVRLPALAFPVALALVGGWLVGGLFWAARARTFDTAFSLLICTSVLASPLTWCHYLVLLAAPLAVAVRQVSVLGFPRGPVYQLLCIAVLLSIPAALFHDAMMRFVQPTQAGAGPPFAASLIDLIPAAAVIALLAFLRELDLNGVRTPAIVDRDAQTAGGG